MPTERLAASCPSFRNVDATPFEGAKRAIAAFRQAALVAMAAKKNHWTLFDIVNHQFGVHIKHVHLREVLALYEAPKDEKA